MATRSLQALADELLSWRTTLARMRDEEGTHVDDLICYFDAAMDSIDRLQFGAAMDMARRNSVMPRHQG